MKPLACVIGPYIGKHSGLKDVKSKPIQDEISLNIHMARQASIYLWQNGYYVFCPHLNSSHFELDCSASDLDFRQFVQKLIKMDLFSIYVCCGDYRHSYGTKQEIRLIHLMQRPLFFFDSSGLTPVDPSNLELNLT